MVPRSDIVEIKGFLGFVYYVDSGFNRYKIKEIWDTAMAKGFIGNLKLVPEKCKLDLEMVNVTADINYSFLHNIKFILLSYLYCLSFINVIIYQQMVEFKSTPPVQNKLGNASANATDYEAVYRKALRSMSEIGNGLSLIGAILTFFTLISFR